MAETFEDRVNSSEDPLRSPKEEYYETTSQHSWQFGAREQTG